ncbi:MAG: 2-amino-4-hydroxy-6-hydroxymethyldihydropteridine diphosphokinase [Paracoccaceae bacterium]
MGSNLSSSAGGPDQTIRSGLAMLEELGIKCSNVSRLFRTPCFPMGAGPDFVNAAASVVCNLPPKDMLTLLHLVESRLGRVRDGRWGARTLDIDLIAMGERVVPDAKTFRHWCDLPPEQQAKNSPDQLILPHPRMHDRAFVLIPLADVAPDWRHPVLGLTVAEMVQNLPKTARGEVIAL